MTELSAGQDFRAPELRHEVWQRFYEFHLRHRAHPGGVYFVLPYVADRMGLGPEERIWWAYLNGNTQHPVTSWQLFTASGGSIDGADAMLAWWREHYARLAWDTDRRYHKAKLDVAVAGYRTALRGADQTRWWGEAAAGGWDEVWRRARALPTFGRLSAFSFTEYLRIMGVDVTCTDLMLGDLPGSKSHRNGMCILEGLDHLDDHASNPRWPGRYPRGLIGHLTDRAADVLAEAQRRAAGTPWQRDVGYFTMESALCTYKSWHRPNRRYPNVYNDLLHDRLIATGKAWPELDLGLFWQARRDSLPERLRLEDQPYDPGCVPAKQNHYRETGEVVAMDLEWPCFANRFQEDVEARAFGRCR